MISLIVAVAENQVIGKNNQLIWHLPADLQYFKEKTLGKPVIMGRKTFDSILKILGKPLPKRQNIVITSHSHVDGESVWYTDNVAHAIELAGNSPEIMVIGGSSIYEQALPLADKIYLTRVHHTFEGDVFFPVLASDVWQLDKEEHHRRDEKNKYDYSFQEYSRIY